MKNAANPLQQNMANRAWLLTTAPRQTKVIATDQKANGQTSRIKLYNVGIITSLFLEVSAAITIGVAIATPSPKAPYNLIQRVRVTDFDGTDHCTLSGFQLFIWNSVRNRTLSGVNTLSGAASFANPVVPTAIGAGTILFGLEVPLAYDTKNEVTQLQDTRGSIYAQTGTGDMYVTIDWNPTLYANGDADAVYNGAPTTTVVGAGNFITCTLYQDFLLPQDSNVPWLDMNTVYAYDGFIRTTDNLAVGQEKQIAVPNNRTVLGAYFNFMQALTLTDGRIDTFKMVVNGNNILSEESERVRKLRMREYIGGDTPPGCYWYRHTARPIEVAIFGNVYYSLKPNLVGASPNIEMGFESMVTKGMALGAITQSSG